MRCSAETPWKPATTATLKPSANLASMFSRGMSMKRAAEWAEVVRIGTCQPCQERAGISHFLQGQRHQPSRHILARGHHRVVFAGVEEGRGLFDPADELVGLAGHGRDDDDHIIAALDLALDLQRRVLDAGEVGHRGAAEFHHQKRHDCLLWRRFSTVRFLCGAGRGVQGGWGCGRVGQLTDLSVDKSVRDQPAPGRLVSAPAQSGAADWQRLAEANPLPASCDRRQSDRGKRSTPERFRSIL